MIELPRGWRNVALGDLGTWYGGGTPSKSRDDFWRDGDIPWLSPKDMGDDVVTATQNHITAAAVRGSSVRRVPAGSVAVVVRSGILERTLPIAVVPMAVTLNQDMKALSPSADIDPHWIAWGLRSRERALLTECRKSGTTVASIDTRRFLASALPVPPLAEQRLIIEVLECHLTHLDAAQRGIEAAKQGLAMLMAASAEYAKRDAAASCELSNLARLAVDARYGTSTKCVVGGSGPAVVRIPNLVAGRIDLTDEKRVQDQSVDVTSAMLRTDDLLVVRTNGSRQLIGRTAVVQPGVDAAFASYLIRYRLDPAIVRSDWVSLMLRAPSTRAVLETMAASSAGQYNLSLSKLGGVRLPVPSLATQDRLLVANRSLSDAAVRLIAERQAAGRRGLALRRGILSAAFAGDFS